MALKDFWSPPAHLRRWDFFASVWGDLGGGGPTRPGSSDSPSPVSAETACFARKTLIFPVFQGPPGGRISRLSPVPIPPFSPKGRQNPPVGTLSPLRKGPRFRGRSKPRKPPANPPSRPRTCAVGAVPLAAPPIARRGTTGFPQLLGYALRPGDVLQGRGGDGERVHRVSAGRGGCTAKRVPFSVRFGVQLQKVPTRVSDSRPASPQSVASATHNRRHRGRHWRPPGPAGAPAGKKWGRDPTARLRGGLLANPPMEGRRHEPSVDLTPGPGQPITHPTLSVCLGGTRRCAIRMRKGKILDDVSCYKFLPRGEQ